VKSKGALVTGASSGIGAATAERLTKADDEVFSTSRRAASAGRSSCENRPAPSITASRALSAPYKGVIREF